MSGTDVNKIGSVTEKAFNKENQQPDKLLDKPDDRDADSFDSQLKQGFKSEGQTNIDGNQIELKQAPDNLADRILNGFQGLKDNVDARQQKIDKMLGSEEILSMKDMFKTQKAITNLMMTEDLIGKVAGKSTQIVETMMKQQ